ncbi:queuine tRNA-ribosyltransferase accessory subunit 2 [Patella vulgata]|uniref:queuine tRNA-ribosyltransferase accessory subunit 2 n=1 Tax=Patella vulgata TaxID=6465 RepID=UPI0021803D7E|nr:queuine tRNA-ribosyltransferase accessory subunit 2 [Patella vulgata]XP_050407075.1 queuine tRNA-ribosyltransferase accessory subunit 2 [Patella vulgata]
MMKFVLKNVKNGCRAGVISELGNHPDKTVDTPFCMLYTRGGSAPHLSRDVLNRLKNLPLVAHMPLNILADHHEAVRKFQHGIGKFAAMKDWIVYCSLHDPSTLVKSGYNDKIGVSVWGKGGKLKLDTELFMKIQESFQPDIYQALSDGDTDINSTRKRCIKVVDRTLSFLDSIVDIHSKSERLKKTAIFGSIVGGYNEAERVRCVKETISRPVQGFVIEGFFNPGPDTEHFQINECVNLLQKIIEFLPVDKPRLMQSVWPPDAVIQAYELGIDIFDSSYPYMVTERNSALVFTYNIPTEETEGEELPDTFEINLSDKKYFDDFSPLLKDCKCFTCENYTRSYVNHLLNTTELLASILLMIHNFHHYFEFFESLRRSISDGKLEELKKLINKQKKLPSVER